MSRFVPVFLVTLGLLFPVFGSQAQPQICSDARQYNFAVLDLLLAYSRSALEAETVYDARKAATDLRVVLEELDARCADDAALPSVTREAGLQTYLDEGAEFGLTGDELLFLEVLYLKAREAGMVQEELLEILEFPNFSILGMVAGAKPGNFNADCAYFLSLDDEGIDNLNEGLSATTSESRAATEQVIQGMSTSGSVSVEQEQYMLQFLGTFFDRLAESIQLYCQRRESGV